MAIRGARQFSRTALAFTLLLGMWALPGTTSAQDNPAAEPAPASADTQRDDPKALEKLINQEPPAIRTLTMEDILRNQIDELRQENQALREMLAQAELDASHAQHQLEELQQFMADHDQYGEDFEKYRGMLEIAERAQRQQRAEEYRERQRLEEAERRARMEQAKAIRAARQAEQNRLRRYERAGFYSIGKEVFASSMAYQYKSKEVPDTSYRFAPLLRFDGTYFFTRYWQIDYDDEIDFTEMTFSGSVLNAADEPRNIGVAITFFDQYGRQVGGQSIEIENARPDAPYPFTHTLAMALNRPFSSYRMVVLYSDPVDASNDESASLNPTGGGVIGLTAKTTTRD